MKNSDFEDNYSNLSEDCMYCELRNTGCCECREFFERDKKVLEEEEYD